MTGLDLSHWHNIRIDSWWRTFEVWVLKVYTIRQRWTYFGAPRPVTGGTNGDADQKTRRRRRSPKLTLTNAQPITQTSRPGARPETLGKLGSIAQTARRDSQDQRTHNHDSTARTAARAAQTTANTPALN